MKRRTIVGLSAVFALLAACGSTTSGQPAPGGPVTVTVTNSPPANPGGTTADQPGSTSEPDQPGGGTSEPDGPTDDDPRSYELDESYQLDQEPDTAVFSGNVAGQVDYTATTQYIEATIANADTVWSNWFASKGLPEPWVTYYIIQPGYEYTSNCPIKGQNVFGSNYPNAFYCKLDMNDHDRGVLVLPVETFAKMWTGNIFETQVSDVKHVGDFAAGAIIAHEFGHHIQDELSEVTGINAPANPNIELIADCFSGIWTYALDTDRMLEAGDLDEALNALNAIGDNEGSHGTGTERKNAFLIGATGSKADPRGGVPENCLRAYWPQVLQQ